MRIVGGATTLRCILLIWVVAAAGCGNTSSTLSPNYAQYLLAADEDVPQPQGTTAEDLSQATTVPPPRDTTPSLRWLALRTGYIMPASLSGLDYESAYAVGLGLQFRRRANPIAFELSGEYAEMEDTFERYRSHLVNIRADLAFYPVTPESPVIPVFIVGGGAMLEYSFERVLNFLYENYGGLVDFGAGLVFTHQRLDIRFTYSFLVAGENAKGLFSIGLGYGF